jgi:hypothetical protein
MGLIKDLRGCIKLKIYSMNNFKWELMKELMITGNQYISTDWAIKNILNLSREVRKEKIKRIFNKNRSNGY